MPQACRYLRQPLCHRWSPVHLPNIVALDLSDGGRHRVCMAVSVVVCRPFRVLVVNTDRMPVIRKFLDNPAVLRASGLDLIEVIRLADEPEIRGSEKCAFLCRKQSASLLPPFPAWQMGCSNKLFFHKRMPPFLSLPPFPAVPFWVVPC